MCGCTAAQVHEHRLWAAVAWVIDACPVCDDSTGEGSGAVQVNPPLP